MRVQLTQVSARHPAAARGSAALHGVDLELAAGEQVAVIGPSGAGKTTLLQAIACALRPVAGSVQLDGVDPWTLPTRALQRLRGQLFLAPQVPPLPPRQRVVTAVLAGRLPAQSLAASLRSLLHPTDSAAAHDALARALVAPARLWLVDEPLSSLDPARARQALAALTGCARERGITLVASLHQVDAALQRFPRIVGLRDGRIAFDTAAALVTQARLSWLYEHDGALQPVPPVAADDAPAWARC